MVKKRNMAKNWESYVQLNKLQWKDAFMHKKRHILSIIVALLFIADAYAGHGLSNEAFITKQWRDLETPRSVLVNPSFAAYCNWITLSSALSMTQLNRFYLAGLQGIIPITPLAYRSHTVGFGYIGYTSGKFDRTVWEGNRICREENGNKYNEHYGTVSYSMQPFPSLAVGSNINFSYQNNFGSPVIDGAFDLGTSYVIDNVNLGKHVFGICFQNPAAISRYERPVFTSDIGVSWGFEKMIKTVAFNGGLEFNYRSFYGEHFGSSRKDVTGRLGAKINKLLQIYIQGGREYLGFSVNFNFDTTSKMLPEKVQSTSTAMQVLFTKAQFAPANTIYLAAELGKNRNVIRGDANEIYMRARQKLADKCYFEAYALFSLFEKEYSRFIKIDEVRMLSAYCLEKMFQHDKCIEKYNQTKELYTYKTSENESNVIGAANLGLLRVYRQTADSQTVVSQFRLLQESKALDTLKAHGWYELGQFYINNEKWIDAATAFEKIKPNHYDYPFAQHSIVMCDEMDNLKGIESDTLKYARSKARRHLKEVIEFNAVSESQKKMQERAKYLLGCAYYENNEFENAHKQLRMIPDTSEYYHDGLNIIGWALFKSKNWGKSREAAEVMQNSDKPEVRADGYILEAYSLLLDNSVKQSNEKRLERAKECTDKALGLLPKIEKSLTIDIQKIRSEIDSLTIEESKLIEDYKNKLESGMERQFLFKTIEEFGKKASKLRNDILYNITVIENTRHYQSMIDRITNIINDAEYLRAIVGKRLMYDNQKNFEE